MFAVTLSLRASEGGLQRNPNDNAIKYHLHSRNSDSWKDCSLIEAPGNRRAAFDEQNIPVVVQKLGAGFEKISGSRRIRLMRELQDNNYCLHHGGSESRRIVLHQPARLQQQLARRNEEGRITK